MKNIFYLLLICIGLTACHGTMLINQNDAEKNVTKVDKSKSSEATEAKAYVEKATAVSTGSAYMTAGVKVNLKSGTKDLSVNGKLQMKRDDCIRLSLRFLGIEVALFEFTPSDVLLVDRANKQYVRARYDEVTFLKTAGLDFYALQALFWDEPFVPGEKSAASAVSRFKVNRTSEGTVLSLTDTPNLHYDFLTNSTDATVKNLSVKSATTGQSGTFGCTYSDFTPFGHRNFPTNIALRFNDEGKALSLEMKLSSLKTDSDWNTRTTISSKYTRRSADQVLKALK